MHMKQFNFERLSTYGLMRDLTIKQISDLILRLTAMQYLNYYGEQISCFKIKCTILASVAWSKKGLAKSCNN